MKPQTLKQLFVMSFLFNFFFIGIIFNTEVIYKNGGKMPILSGASYNTETHFTYQDKDEVERWYLTDIIPLGKNKKYSIGDFFLVASSLFIFLYSCYCVIQKFWRKEGGVSNY